MNITNIEQLNEVIEFVKANDILAYDTETNSLNFKTGVVIGFGISNADKGYYISNLIWNKQDFEQVIPKDKCIELLNLLQNKKL